MWSLLPLLSLCAYAQEDEEKPEYKETTEIDFSAVGVEGSFAPPSPMKMHRSLAATPGGAQDIKFFRDRVEGGEIPHPSVFTPEGLFSEHDLPLTSERTCERLICTNTKAMAANLLVQDEVRYLAQLGFDSGLTEATFTPPPLNLVAVIDQSGSMSGTPLETVKESLREVAKQLGPSDQLSIILYGSGTFVHMPPTRGGLSSIDTAIDAIQSQGSTNMEAGMKLGFETARTTRRSFDGTTRVMLFTDERPNTGRTDAEGFMSIAEQGSADGIGMTTVGVGVQFGAELATKISSVRGGNLFFFPNVPSMRESFADKFDTMFVELAYDMELEVYPASGLKIAGVYGIPGDMLEWTQDGGIRLEIATLFLSRDAGAIYVSFSNGDSALPSKKFSRGAAVGSVQLSYDPRDGGRVAATQEFGLQSGIVDDGLRRGHLLVDEATALKKATALHHENNDQEGAYQIAHALASQFRDLDDPDMSKEVKLVLGIEKTLAHLSGRQGEDADLQASIDPITGLPRR